MNIFILSEDPVLAAQYQADTHVIKMSLESAQLLSTAAVELFPADVLPTHIYAATHKHHPCTVWTASSFSNFKWLCIHGLSLCREYTYRYRRIHKSKQIISSLYALCRGVPKDERTPFAMAMPDEFKTNCPVQAYRAYYKYKRQHLHRFTYTNRSTPEWLI